jgi:hypothetical protein
LPAASPAFRRWRGLFGDAIGLIALVWAIPFAVLAVGTPLALVVLLALWLGRLAAGAF